ncbi:GTP-binding protein [Hominifimenecus microfluidus]|uniref:TIGR03943 family putative permease subunit n=1 Tax=Hominifimenecus microfluidus TaxID=2885348 RepID=UPI0032C037B0
MEVPVYVFTGFLDSGKTTLLKDTLSSPDFETERTLIILCEEGDEEYDEQFLSANGAYVVTVESQEKLTDSLLVQCAKKFDPDQVMIEWNGTWPMSTLFDREFPKHWECVGIYSTVDATTAEMYMTNMRAMFLEQLSQSGLIIFNRTPEEMDRARMRRLIKANNPPAQIVFEREDGEMYDPADEPMPFDVTGPVIEIEDMDYGLWYLDAREHPERYKGKQIRFLAQVYRGRNLKPGTFVPGRFIMTCCADDIRFMGYICRFIGDFPYQQRDWVKVTVDFGFEYVKAYGEKVPVLTLREALPAKKPSQDPVYFT